jgi:2-methylaconitate cis-trans-isomerase PrpF
MEVEDLAAGLTVRKAAILRTARKLFEGRVFPGATGPG